MQPNYQAKVEECCSWCEQPISGCRSVGCDDARTYAGVYSFGKWIEADESDGETSERAAA